MDVTMLNTAICNLGKGCRDRLSLKWRSPTVIPNSFTSSGKIHALDDKSSMCLPDTRLGTEIIECGTVAPLTRIPDTPRIENANVYHPRPVRGFNPPHASRSAFAVTDSWSVGGGERASHYVSLRST